MYNRLFNPCDKTISSNFVVQENPIINPDSGLVEGIPFYNSPFPNAEDRPNINDINLLVIHDTEIVAPDKKPYDKSIVHYMFTQQYDRLKTEYPEDYEKIFPGGQTRDVSSHIVLRRNGDMFQYVSFNRLAHHAGVSQFSGRERCNDFSIGIELEGFANREDFPFTDMQYQQLARLTMAIMKTYPQITLERITGHENIAQPIGRKTDPGKTFNWERYKNLVKQLQLSEQPDIKIGYKSC
jgi:N-acetyl-anhydromuramoyl-L-alanine amidase